MIDKLLSIQVSKKVYRIISLALFLFGITFTNAFAQLGTVYISPNGTSEAAGTKDDPTNLETAVQKISAILIANEFTNETKILALPGNYNFTKSISLGSEFVGSADKPIIIEPAEEGSLVEFDGSLPIPVNDFKPVTDPEIKKRLAAAAADKILVTTIEDETLQEKLENNLLIKLNIDGKDYLTSTFPDNRKAQFGSLPIEHGVTPPGIPFDRAFVGGLRAGQAPYVEPGKPEFWKGSLEEPRGPMGGFRQDYGMGGTWQQWEDELKADNTRNTLQGFFEANWLFSQMPIVSADASKQGIRLSKVLSYGWKPEKVKEFNIYGLLCELTQPGEWYYDVNTKKFYVYPITPGKVNSAFLPFAGGFLNLNNTQHVHIKNIGVKNVVSGNIIKISGGSNNLVAGCKVYNSSATGLRIESGNNHRVQSCDFVDLYAHVIVGGGIANETELIPGNNTVENCHFYQKNYTDRKINIAVTGFENDFRNNLVHHSIGQSIVVVGNGHDLELNEVFNVGYEEGDGGAIYSGGNMVGYGNTYKNNFVHHIIHAPGKFERAGMYMDDQQGGSVIIANVFYKSAHHGIKYHAGAGHVSGDNIFLKGNNGARGIGGTTGSQQHYNTEQAIKTNPNHPSKGKKEDYVGNAERIVGVKGWENEPWKSKYPLMNTVMSDDGVYGRLWPVYHTHKGNHYYDNRSNSTTLGNLNSAVTAKNTISDGRRARTTDFEDYNKMNFKIKASSGFVPVNFDQIGLYLDEYRCSMAIKSEYRNRVKTFFDGINSWTGTSNQIDTGTLIETLPKESNCTFAGEIPVDNFKLKVTDVTCVGKNNGNLIIEAVLDELDYTATLKATGIDTSREFTKSKRGIFPNLPAGTYELCITIKQKASYNQCYTVIIGQPASLKVSEKVSQSSKEIELNLDGSDQYFIELNGDIFTTSQNKITLQLKNGENNLTVKTDKDCQGTHSKKITIDDTDVNIYPIPAIDDLHIEVDSTIKEITVLIQNATGKNIKVLSPTLEAGKTTIDISDLPTGVYYILVNSNTIHKTIQVLKI